MGKESPQLNPNPEQENKTIFGMTPEQIGEMRADILKWDREQGGCEEDVGE